MASHNHVITMATLPYPASRDLSSSAPAAANSLQIIIGAHTHLPLKAYTNCLSVTFIPKSLHVCVTIPDALRSSYNSIAALSPHHRTADTTLIQATVGNGSAAVGSVHQCRVPCENTRPFSAEGLLIHAILGDP